MEELIRQRDGADPRFAFINGGEGYDYFRYAVSCLQQGVELPLPPPPSLDSLQPNIDMIDGATPGGGQGGGGAGRNGESNQVGSASLLYFLSLSLDPSIDVYIHGKSYV